MTMNRLRTILTLTVLMTTLSAADKACINSSDLKQLKITLQNFHQAIEDNDLDRISSFMHFPITDNHNHAITKRVFLEEDTYAPVINVRKVLREAFPKSLELSYIKEYRYLDTCNKYVIENSTANHKKGLRFIFKKIGQGLKLKLIR